MRWVIGVIVDDQRGAINIQSKIGVALAESVEEPEGGLMTGIEKGGAGCDGSFKQREKREMLHGFGIISLFHCHEVDRVGRLIKASNSPSGTSQSKVTRYTYNGLNDRLQETVNGVTTTCKMNL